MAETAHKDRSARGKPHGKQPASSLARSRLNRSGLKAGTAAPDFRLPRVDGGELSLSELRGRRVLLVFSDPDCGPCDQWAPRLQELHEQRPDLQVVVVSRRDAKTNHAKSKSLGLSYPIVLQKQWEISLKYGMAPMNWSHVSTKSAGTPAPMGLITATEFARSSAGTPRTAVRAGTSARIQRQLAMRGRAALPAPKGKSVVAASARVPGTIRTIAAAAESSVLLT